MTAEEIADEIRLRLLLEHDVDIVGTDLDAWVVAVSEETERTLNEMFDE